MNPLFLLFGFFGAGAVSRGFSAKGKGTPIARGDRYNADEQEDGSEDTTDQEDETGSGVTADNETDTNTTNDSGSDGSTEGNTTGGTDAVPADEEAGADTNTTDDSGSDGSTEGSNTGDGTSGPDITVPNGPTQTNDTGSDGANTPSVVADGTIDVVAGRVATLSASGDDIASVSVVSEVDFGTITVNPDNTLALVMTQSDFVGAQSFTYEATHTDGSTSLHEVQLNVTPGAQAGGWATGEMHYMLETDASDKVVVEHGEVHTKVYISGGSEGLSLGDIATRENMDVSQITGDWLAANGTYGQSEALALDETAGMALWDAVTPENSETSNWLLLERGHDYSDLGRILERGTDGESEMNPLYLGAWGDGDAPNVTTQFMQSQESSSNLVVQDIHFSEGIFFLDAENVIFDNVKVTGDEMAVIYSSGITIRNSEFIDHVNEASWDGGAWDAMDDRVQGLYMNVTDGVLLEGNFFDLNGWSETYQTDGSQSPSMFSHNIYLGENMSDITLRDTITMRAASSGLGIRSGGFLEDNLILDNNVSLSFTGGDYADAGPVGNYTLLADNVITSGAHKEADMIGALARGIYSDGELSSLVDNIVAHLADPNGDETFKQYAWDGLENTKETYYDDTIVWNWEGAQAPSPSTVTELNAEGLDSSILDQTTIQLFTAQLLNKSDATISDLADYLRAQADGAFDDVVDADLIIRFFQEGFGIAPDIRDTADTLRFVPDDLGDGIRWDNRLNWDSDDLPGLHAADSADLGGNHVVYGTNTTIDTLNFGPDGALNVYGGRLDLTGGVTGDTGALNLEGTGQFWTEGSDAADLDVAVTGGRFVNTGDMAGTDLTATGGQTILATGGSEFEVSSSKTLAVFKAAAKIGFDGDDGGIAILDMHEDSTLAFAAQDGGLGTIEEFRSGAFGDSPDVQSGINLGDATLSIDLAGISAQEGAAFTLMDTDEIVGIFGEANVNGLGGRDARIVIDYENDSVTLELSSGSGSVTVDTIGAQTDVTSGEEALWNALTEGQGVVAETAAMPPENEEDPMDIAA